MFRKQAEEKYSRMLVVVADIVYHCSRSAVCMDMYSGVVDTVWQGALTPPFFERFGKKESKESLRSVTVRRTQAYVAMHSSLYKFMSAHALLVQVVFLCRFAYVSNVWCISWSQCGVVVTCRRVHRV